MLRFVLSVSSVFLAGVPGWAADENFLDEDEHYAEKNVQMMAGERRIVQGRLMHRAPRIRREGEFPRGTCVSFMRDDFRKQCESPLGRTTGHVREIDRFSKHSSDWLVLRRREVSPVGLKG